MVNRGWPWGAVVNRGWPCEGFSRRGGGGQRGGGATILVVLGMIQYTTSLHRKCHGRKKKCRRKQDLLAI